MTRTESDIFVASTDEQHNVPHGKLILKEVGVFRPKSDIHLSGTWLEMPKHCFNVFHYNLSSKMD